MRTIKQQINYLVGELAHERYYDGYAVAGMRDELEYLRTKQLADHCQGTISIDELLLDNSGPDNYIKEDT
tara:strand:- start:3018 stop:3227 length:210 start_codon:yes stop_codon:yes gene_type:complete